MATNIQGIASLYDYLRENKLLSSRTQKEKFIDTFEHNSEYRDKVYNFAFKNTPRTDFDAFFTSPDEPRREHTYTPAPTYQNPNIPMQETFNPIQEVLQQVNNRPEEPKPTAPRTYTPAADWQPTDRNALDDLTTPERYAGFFNAYLSGNDKAEAMRIWQLYQSKAITDKEAMSRYQQLSRTPSVQSTVNFQNEVLQNRADRNLTHSLSQAESDVDAQIATLQNKKRQDTTARFTPAGGIYVNAQDAQNRASRRELADLTDARANLKEARQIIDAAQANKRDDSGISRLGQGVADGLFTADAITFGLASLVRNTRMLDLINRANDQGVESLTESEQTLLNSAIIRQAVEAAHASGAGYLYNMGRITGESIPYMLQFIATGIPAKAITAGANKAIVKYIGKFLQSKGMKSALAQGTGRATAWLGTNTLTAAARTPFAPTMYADAAKRQIGNIDYQETADSRLQYVGNSGDNPAAAFAKAYGNTFFENFGEESGVILEAATKKLADIPLLSKAFGKVAESSLGRMWRAGTDNFMGDFYRAAGYNGIFGEAFEEYVSGTLNAATIGDQSFSELFSADNFITTVGGVGLTSILLGTAHGTLGAATTRRIRSDYNGATEMAVANYTPAEIEAMKNIATGTPSSITAYLAQNITERNNLKSAIYQYTSLGEESKVNELGAQLDDLRRRYEFVSSAAQYNAYIGGLSERIQPIIEREREKILTNSHAASGQTIEVDVNGRKGYLVGGRVDVINIEDSATASQPTIVGDLATVRFLDNPEAVDANVPVENISITSYRPTDELINAETAAIRAAEAQAEDMADTLIPGEAVALRNMRGNFIFGGYTPQGELLVTPLDAEGNPVTDNKGNPRTITVTPNQVTTTADAEAADATTPPASLTFRPGDYILVGNDQNIYSVVSQTADGYIVSECDSEGNPVKDNAGNPVTRLVKATEVRALDDTPNTATASDSAIASERLNMDNPTLTELRGEDQSDQFASSAQFAPESSSPLSMEQADALISQMEANAEVAPEIELTIENWDAQFGENGTVSTPIGDVKMGENQFTKLMRQGRDGKLGMIKPTLQSPDFVIEDESIAKEGDTTERASSYIFVKTFQKPDGSRYYYFTSVTVSRDGHEVIISNQEKRKSVITNLLMRGKLIWKRADNVSTASDVADGLYSSQGNTSDLTTEGTDAPQTNYSTAKDMASSPQMQENEGKNVDAHSATDLRGELQNTLANNGEEYAVALAQMHLARIKEERDKAQKALYKETPPVNPAKYRSREALFAAIDKRKTDEVNRIARAQETLRRTAEERQTIEQFLNNLTTAQRQENAARQAEAAQHEQEINHIINNTSTASEMQNMDNPTFGSNATYVGDSRSTSHEADQSAQSDLSGSSVDTSDYNNDSTTIQGETPTNDTRKESGIPHTGSQATTQRDTTAETPATTQPTTPTVPPSTARSSSQNGEREVEISDAENSQNKENELYLQQQNQPAQQDEISQSIPQGERGTQNAQDRRMAQAESAIRRSQSSGTDETQLSGSQSSLSRQEIEQRAAETYAKESGTWIPIYNLDDLGIPGPSGNEADTYIGNDGYIYKVNNLMNSGSILSLFERIKLHNKTFPSSSYEFIGFTGIDGRSIYPIFKQRYIQSATNATPQEIEAYMTTLGFTPISDHQYRGDAITISDLRPRNVLKGTEGDLYVVDAEFTANTASTPVGIIDQARQATQQPQRGKKGKGSNLNNIILSEGEYAERRAKEIIESNPNIDEVDAFNAAIDEYPLYIRELIESGELSKIYEESSIGDRIKIGKYVNAAGFETSDISELANQKRKQEKENNIYKVGQNVTVRYLDGSIVNGVIERAEKGKIYVRSSKNSRLYSVSEERVVNANTQLQVEPNSTTTSTSIEATDIVLQLLEDAGIEVVTDTKEIEEVLEANERLQEMKKSALETVSAREEHHPTVVSSTDGAKVLNNLQSLANEYEEKNIQRPILLIGDLAKALGMPPTGRKSQYGTFETKNGKIITIYCCPVKL